MSRIYKAVSSKTYAQTLAVLFILIIINIFIQDNFFSSYNLKSLIMTYTPLILLSMAHSIIIISGELDLSIGAGITLLNVILASIMTDSAGSIVFAIILAALAAVAVGSANGFIISFFKVPSLISTFAMSSVLVGISLFIMPSPGGYVPSYFYRFYQANVLYFIPVPLVLIFFAILIWHLIYNSKIGTYIYAVGGNEEGAKLSGVKIVKVKTLAFVTASIFSILAAIALTAQTASGDANIGQPLTLTTVAATVLGGISLQGGKGNPIGAALGACIMGLLVNIIFFANISSFWQETFKGILIIVALGLSAIPKIKQSQYNI